MPPAIKVQCIFCPCHIHLSRSKEPIHSESQYRYREKGSKIIAEGEFFIHRSDENRVKIDRFTMPDQKSAETLYNFLSSYELGLGIGKVFWLCSHCKQTLSEDLLCEELQIAITEKFMIWKPFIEETQRWNAKKKIATWKSSRNNSQIGPQISGRFLSNVILKLCSNFWKSLFQLLSLLLSWR